MLCPQTQHKGAVCLHYFNLLTYFSQAEIGEILAGRERRISLGTLSLR
jgi:hypothetical protein